MKTRLFILTPTIALALTLLSACAKPLDPETRALAEACDAVCMGRVESWEQVPCPEGTDLDLYCTQRWDGSRWAVLVKLRLTADFSGNLTLKGTSYRYIFVLMNADWHQPVPDSGKPEHILFLDVVPGLTQRDTYSGIEYDCPVFTPHGPEGVRWRTGDVEGIRLIEALRAWSKSNRRELIPHAAQ